MPNDRSMQVLLIEDHALVRGLIANHLRGQFEHCEIIEADFASMAAG